MATARSTNVARAAYNAGLRGTALVTSVAVGLAESGGNPAAHNATPPDDSWGVWQVNYYGGLRAPRTASYGPPQGQTDINTNARTMAAISNGGANFRAWTTYTSGRYRAFIGEAQDAVNSIGASTGTSMGGSLDGLYTAAGHNTGTAIASYGTQEQEEHCLVGAPSVGVPLGSLPIIPNKIGGWCLLSTNHARAIGGMAILITGGFVIGVGVILIVRGSVAFPHPAVRYRDRQAQARDDRLAAEDESLAAHAAQMREENRIAAQRARIRTPHGIGRYEPFPE